MLVMGLRNSSPLNRGIETVGEGRTAILRVSELEISGCVQPSVNLMSSRFFQF